MKDFIASLQNLKKVSSFVFSERLQLFVCGRDSRIGCFERCSSRFASWDFGVGWKAGFRCLRLRLKSVARIFRYDKEEAKRNRETKERTKEGEERAGADDGS